MASVRALIGKDVRCEVLLTYWYAYFFFFVLRKKGSKTKERMKEEEIGKALAGRHPEKSFFDFVGLEPSGT